MERRLARNRRRRGDPQTNRGGRPHGGRRDAGDGSLVECPRREIRSRVRRVVFERPRQAKATHPTPNRTLKLTKGSLLTVPDFAANSYLNPLQLSSRFRWP